MEGFYLWWRNKIEQEVKNDINSLRSEEGDRTTKLASKLGEALSSFADENCFDFFRKWVELYLSYMFNNHEIIDEEIDYTYKSPGEYTIHKMCFKDLFYALNWEEAPHDFEYDSMLTEQQIDDLRDLLGPLAGENFRKLNREWYKTDY